MLRALPSGPVVGWTVRVGTMEFAGVPQHRVEHGQEPHGPMPRTAARRPARQATGGPGGRGNRLLRILRKSVILYVGWLTPLGAGCPLPVNDADQGKWVLRDPLGLPSH